MRFLFVGFVFQTILSSRILYSFLYFTMKHLFLSLFLSCIGYFGFAQNSEIFWLGADISGCTQQEKSGSHFYDWEGQERETTELMQVMGLNAVRLRVWVNPVKHGNWCNIDDLLVKAHRAKALGMEIMVDFHYSDWWADPAKQNIPEAWLGHDFDQMKEDLRQHTLEVLGRMKEEELFPRWVQVGNETSRGLLWSVKTDPKTGWELKDEKGNTTITVSMGHLDRNPQQYAGFIRAGYDAVKEVFPESLVIVHLDNGYDSWLYNHNLDVLRDGGAKWDIIGMSLYPYWTQRSHPEYTFERMLEECMQNIRDLAAKYGTDAMIVETGFEVDEEQPEKMELGRLQLATLIDACKNQTEGHCHGVFYWEPTSNPRHYKLGAFDSKGHPTAIMRGWRD